MGVVDFRLDQRVALVTGAGSGIGRRIAIGLTQAGADVGCLDVPSSDLDGVVTEIVHTGRTAIAVPADVTDAAGRCDTLDIGSSTEPYPAC